METLIAIAITVVLFGLGIRYRRRVYAWLNCPDTVIKDGYFSSKEHRELVLQRRVEDATGELIYMENNDTTGKNSP